jgi:hypothetical protein
MRRREEIGARQLAPGDTALTAILIRAQINSSVPDHTLRDDLLHLKRLGMVDSRGHGRGAVWFLGVAPKLEGGPNKAE